MDLSFPKTARLHHRTLVNNLFAEGKSIYDFPLRLVWLDMPQERLGQLFRHGIPEGIGRVQMMVTVPKKKLHRAVDRVKMRRRIREAYRLMRPQFEEMLGGEHSESLFQLAFIYLAPEVKSSESVARHMKGIAEKLGKTLAANPSSQDSL